MEEEEKKLYFTSLGYYIGRFYQKDLDSGKYQKEIEKARKKLFNTFNINLNYINKKIGKNFVDMWICTAEDFK